jgi:hypothetical protein
MILLVHRSRPDPRIVPTVALELDLSHPLAAGLLYCLLPGGASALTDLTSRWTTLQNGSGLANVATSMGPCLSFTVGNSYLSVNKGFAHDYPQPLTYSFWVNIPSLPVAEILFDDSGWSGTAEIGGLGVGIGNGDASTSGSDLLIPFWGVSWQDTGVTLSTGWNHIVVVLQSSHSTAYLNGALAFTGSSTMATPQAWGLLIGADADPGSLRYSKSTFANFYVHSRALSAGEIARLYLEPFAMLRPLDRRTFYAPIVASETITVDKWFQPAAQPRLARAEMVPY